MTMKFKISKLFIFAFVFWQPINSTDYAKTIEKLRTGDKITLNLSAFFNLAINSYTQSKTFHSLNKAHEMPSDIAEWCRFILKSYNIDCSSIKFKILREGGFCNLWASFGKNFITLDPELVKIISDALMDPNLPANKKTLSMHEFLLLHEYGHLNSFDTFKRYLVAVASLPVINKLMNKLTDPVLNKIKNNDLKNSGLSLLIFLIKRVAIGNLNNRIVTNFMRYQESQADYFAISKINDIEKIDNIIEFMRNVHQNLLSIIRNPAIITNSKDINILIKLNFKNSFELAKNAYQLANSKEDFCDWLEKNPFWLRMIHMSYDPSHPMALDRIKILEQRKNKLLDKNKI